MCYLGVQQAAQSYVHVTHGWAAFLLLSATQGRDCRKAEHPDYQQRGEEEWEQQVQYQNTYVAKWNEVPIVADKIILLPWLPSLNSFEHNKCSLLCCWQNRNYVSVTQINIGPSNTSLELVIRDAWFYCITVRPFVIFALYIIYGCTWAAGKPSEDSCEIKAPWESVQTRKSCGKAG